MSRTTIIPAAAAATGLALLCFGNASLAHAQQQDGGTPQGGFGGPGGGRGGFGGGPGGPGMRGGMRGPAADLTVADLPIALLTTRLNLSTDQVQRITEIENSVQSRRDTVQQSRQNMMTQMQQMRGNNAAANGQTASPPDAQTMQQMRAQMESQMQQMREAEMGLQSATQDATRLIEQALSIDQRQVERALVKDTNLLRAVGLPYPVLSDVTLTDAERDGLTRLKENNQREEARRMTQLSRQRGGFGGPGGGANRQEMEQLRAARHAAALAVLSAEHQTAVTAYEKAHPQTDPGPDSGPGGFGGGPGGGGPG